MFVVRFNAFLTKKSVSNSLLILYNLMSLKSDALLSKVCISWLFRSLTFSLKKTME